MRDALIVTRALEHPWAILDEMGPIIAGVIVRHLSGVSRADLAVVAQAPREERHEAGGVAVLPLAGVLVPRGDLISESSGMMSLDGFSRRLGALSVDPAVSAIVVDADTPGGSVAGATEAAATMRAAAARKPVVVVAHHQLASAGYWVASPSATVGSIGVYALHSDVSAALAQQGVSQTLISAGKYKVEGNAFEALSDEARAAYQSVVDDAYGQFVGDVARGRGVSADAVRSGYGQGRSVPAQRALDAGLVDRIDTLEAVVQQLATSARAKSSRQRAAQRALAGA